MNDASLINKYSDVPLYCQLKNIIIRKIESGEYAADSQIPSEQELCGKYNISRPTVRQAINELTNSGYIYKEKGKGTFVSKAKSRIDIKNYTGFTDSILDSQIPGERSIISAEIIGSSGNLANIFNMPYNQKADFAEIKYLSRHNDEAFSLNTSYISLALFPSILEDVNSKKPSYDILRGKYPLIPSKSKSTLEVIYIDKVDAQYMQIQPGQPVIMIENILLAKNGQVVEYIKSKYRIDKCRLAFEHTKG